MEDREEVLIGLTLSVRTRTILVPELSKEL